MQRYLDFHEYSLKTYGKKTARLLVDAGCTCPNRDGHAGIGGCLFCAVKPEPAQPIAEQLKIQAQKAKEKWSGALRFVAYFYAFTNTHGDPQKLKQMYQEAVDFGVDGLYIATRGDCLSTPILDILEAMNQQVDVIVELGMQTVNDQTLLHMERGYPHAVLASAVDALQQRGIGVVLHLIVGYPGETMDDYARAIAFCNEKKVHGVKIHQLFLERGARLTAQYEAAQFPLLEKEEYEGIVAQLIEQLHPEIVVYRLTGDPQRDTLVAPLWTRDKLRVISGIRKRLKDEQIQQGQRRDNDGKNNSMD